MISYLLVFTLILGILGGSFYYAYEIGWVEKTLSEMVLPFQWFGQSEIEPIGHLQVQDLDRHSIREYKKAIKSLTEQLEEDYKKKPELDDLSITKEDKENLAKIIEDVYGVEYTYISQANLVGFLLTSDGWFGLMNLAVVGDSLTYDNQVIAFQLDADSQITHLSRYSQDEQSFAYTEIPDDFDISLLDRAIAESQTAFTDIKIAISRDPFFEENKRFLKNQVLSKVQFIYSYVRIYTIHSVGTDDGIKEYRQTFHLDKDF